jgi:hypothetical protein
MSVLEIIVLVVVVGALLFALFVFLPRIRARGQAKMRERELKQRRDRVVSEQREAAEDRARRAEAAERRARIAEHEARRERAEAQLREERAALHERGMADHELIEDHEREHFAATSAVADKSGESDDEDRSEQRGSSAYHEGRRSVREPGRGEDFQRGRRDEKADGDGLLGRFRRRREKSEQPS